LNNLELLDKRAENTSLDVN
jgi:phage gpG-like protein